MCSSNNKIDSTNNQIDSNHKDKFLASNLIVIPKSGPEFAIRPISMGEIFVKIAWKLVLNQIDMKEVFKSQIQKGIKFPGGSTAAIISAQTALEAGRNEKVVVFKFDFRNAYQEVDRILMADSLFHNQSTRAAYRLFHFCYSEASNLILRNGQTISSSTGSRQGCVGGGFAYCVAVDPIYAAVKEEGKDITANAIIDDFSIVGKIENTIRAARKLMELSEKYHLPLNLTKCKILWPYDEAVPIELLNFIQETGMKLEIGAMELHGSAIGLDVEKRQEIITSLFGNNQQFFDIVNHEKFPAQIATQCLRINGLTKSQYMSQTAPPSITIPILKMFGDQIINSVKSKIFDDDLNEEASILLQTPVAMGGWGLTCPSIIAPIAYVCSLARTAPALTNINLPKNESNTYDDTVLIPSIFEAKQILSTIDDEINQGRKKQNLPSVDMEIGLVVPPLIDSDVRLQSQITKCLLLARLRRTLKEKPKPFRNRIHALNNEYVKKFHSLRPSHPKLIMNDVEYKLAARNLINLPPVKNMPTICFCGSNISKQPDHLQYCPKTRNNEVAQRHNNIRNALGYLSSIVGSFAGEGRVSRNNSERVDGIVYLLHSTQSFDVSIIHCNSPSYQELDFSDKRLIDARNNKKNNQYLEAEKRNNRNFCPFIMTSYGGFNASAIALISRMSQEAALNGQWTEKTFFHFAISYLLVTLHKGNARISKQGVAGLRAQTDNHGNQEEKQELLRDQNHRPVSEIFGLHSFPNLQQWRRIHVPDLQPSHLNLFPDLQEWRRINSPPASPQHEQVEEKQERDQKDNEVENNHQSDPKFAPVPDKNMVLFDPAKPNYCHVCLDDVEPQLKNFNLQGCVCAGNVWCINCVKLEIQRRSMCVGCSYPIFELIDRSSGVEQRQPIQFGLEMNHDYREALDADFLRNQQIDQSEQQEIIDAISAQNIQNGNENQF